MTHTRAFTLTALFSVLPLAAACAQDPPAPSTPHAQTDLAALVPATTRFYVSVPSLSRSWAGFRTLPLHQVFRDEEVRAFLQALGEGDDWPLAGLSQESLGELLDLPAIFDGQVAFALIDRDQDDWVLSLASSQDAARVENFAEQLLVALRGPLLTGPDSKALAGARVLTLRGPVRDWHAATTGGRLLLSPSLARVESVLSGAESGALSLAEDKDFRRSSAGLVDGTTSFFFYVPLRRLLDEQIAEAGEQRCDALFAAGCDALGSLGAALAISEGRTREVARIEIDGQRRGFFDLLAEGPVDPALARLAPPDALVFAAGRVRVKELHQTWIVVRRALKLGLFSRERLSDEPPAEDATAPALEAVVESLGQNVALLVSAPGTSGIIPFAALAIEALRPDELQSHLAALCAAFLDKEVLTTTYRGRTIAYSKEKDGWLMRFSPCWCVTDGYLLLSHHTTILKEIISRLDGSTTTLADDPAFRGSWEMLPPEARLVAYANTRRAFHFLYGLVRSFTSVIPTWQPATAILPTAESIAAHLSFGLSGLVVDKRGLMLVSESNGYGPTSLAMYGLVAAVVSHCSWAWLRDMKHVGCGYALSRFHEDLTHCRQRSQRFPPEMEAYYGNRTSSWWYDGCAEAKQESVDPDSDSPLAQFTYVVTATGIEPPEAFPDDWMVVWDSEPRHNNGRMVLLGSGEITWLPEPAFQQRLDEQMQK